MAWVVDSAARAGHGERLAWIAGSDPMNAAAKRARVEGSNVAMDRRARKGALLHARDQDRGRMGFPFHVHDRASSSTHEELKSELEPSNPGT